MVQSNHATLTIASSAYDFEGIPNIVLIGVPDKSALERVERRLAENSIPHCSWHEPDGDLGFTSIATVPLTLQQKECLAHYRLWKPLFSGSSVGQSASQPSKVAERSVVRVHPGEPTIYAPVVQPAEQRSLNP